MARRVFVTGGGGFVGQRFLQDLAASPFEVVALDRSGKLSDTGRPGFQIVKGNLDDGSTYRHALASCDTVVHLAAATGNASKDVHHRVNARGTATLVDEAKRAGVSDFLFVSSIAVAFGDTTGYHYAQTKAMAEASVRESGLRFLIVRPTMILGPDAPILKSLGMLATLPVAVLPGNGRVLVQPIHVQDVVSCLMRVLETGGFCNATITISGSEQLSIEALLRRIRLVRRGAPGPLLHLPLPALQVPLRLAEKVGLGGMLPITAGQLSSFRFDAVGTPNFLQDACPPSFSTHEMVERVAKVTPAAARPRPAPDPTELDRECDVFTRHLLGIEAGEYVRTKYRAAHASLPALTASSAFDAFLVKFARRGRIFAKLADAHAALFAPVSLLRKKLVLLLAILETCPPSFRSIDAPLGGQPLGALLALSVTGVSAVLSLIVGSLILLPVRAVLAVGARSAR